MKVEKPQRRRHTYVQQLSAPPARVFPLLCPVRERDWVPEWDPSRVISASGIAEEGCVFITSAAPGDAIWVVTRHDAGAGRLQMIKVTPEHTVCRLDIALTADGGGGSRARVTYEYTALGPAGERFLDTFTEQEYRRFMGAWETALNHFLTTGTMLPQDASQRG